MIGSFSGRTYGRLAYLAFLLGSDDGLGRLGRLSLVCFDGVKLMLSLTSMVIARLAAWLALLCSIQMVSSLCSAQPMWSLPGWLGSGLLLTLFDELGLV